MSLRTRTFLLFLSLVLLPLGAVGVVASIGTRMAVDSAVRAAVEQSSSSTITGIEPELRPEGTAPFASVSTDELLAPVDRLMLVYVALMLLVAAATTLAFRMVSRRIFRSLDDFREAVEQIARGDFAPWLPPPGDDEVGWLSMALGRMAERLGGMMRSIEQGSRLAMVGEMAAHMAHEVRTPLSSIKMNLQMLRRSADAGQVPPTVRASIDTSLSEIARLETAVTRILQLGGPERTWRELCSLHELISEAADVVESGFAKSGIAVRLDLDAESDRISADRSSVKGVFLNLLVNARDAMQGRGEISIETQLFLDESGMQMTAVAVSDSGPGVPFALRDEIFHPFFTTKKDGYGIGLPASLKALREHGGDLYLSERPDGERGACFVLLFPLASPNWTDEVARPHVDPTSVAPTGGWRKPPATRLPWRRVSELPAKSEHRGRGEATTPGALH